MADSEQFSFTLEKTNGRARAGTFTTAHGSVQTPVFMPVGTVGSVKALDAEDIAALSAQIILGNTYHLYLRPGLETLQAAGGLHSFMNWQGPILTDSGGYQVLSLGGLLKASSAGSRPPQLATVTDEGVNFRSHIDGSEHFFTPEKSLEIQRVIGSDIMMAFDEALSDSEPRERAEASLARTHAWAKRCIEYWEGKNRQTVYGKYQALFGIIQGGLFQDLREKSAAAITALPFDGIAVGGETIGYNMVGTVQVMDWIEAGLPANKPRYAMGLGRDPQDIIDAVWAGFDMFDCVGPTRLARNGAVYAGELDLSDATLAAAGKPLFRSEFTNARMSIGASRFATDFDVLQPGCHCHTCQSGYSRAYLHHLYKTRELSYYRLASIHNLFVMLKLAADLRQYILR